MFAQSFVLNRSNLKRTTAQGPGCCPPDPSEDDEKDGTVKEYQSGSIARYCDILASGVQGNTQMVGDIIRDLQCVFEKTYGDSQSLQCKQRSLKEQVRMMKKDIYDLQGCIQKQNHEIGRLQMELKAAQSAFEQEAQRRLGLETYTTQLRARMSRAEAEAEQYLKEKSQLECCVRELQLKMKELGDTVECLTLEKDKLVKNCQGFEEWKSRTNSNISEKSNRCGQLEEALSKCCKANEELLAEVETLRKERDCLKLAVEQMQTEMKRLREEYEKAKQCWETERQCLHKTINELKQNIEFLTVQNKQICQKMKDVTSAHHFEMNCLKEDADKWKKLYGEEKAQKEKLEKLLEDCEERKRQLIKQSKAASKNTAGESVDSYLEGMNKYPNSAGQNSSTNNQKSTTHKGSERQNNLELVGLKEELQVAKIELKTQQESLTRLRSKADHYKEALRAARERERNQDSTTDTKVRELRVKLDQLKSEHENFVRNANSERETLVTALRQLEKEKDKIELAYKGLQLEMKANTENANAIQEIIKRKDKLEAEMERLRRSIPEKYVDRAAVTKWKETYESRINELTISENYERSMQTRIHAATVKLRAEMEKEMYDRNFAEKLREKTEHDLRTEYQQMVSSYKADMEKFKHLIRTRDQEISSLKTSIDHLKHKYSSEASMKDELIKKFQIVATASGTSLLSLTGISSSNTENNNSNRR